MASMGRYCKAYLASRFREYPSWSPNIANLRPPESTEENAGELRTELKDDDILYLQENLIVTDGIFIDANVVFDHVTPEWSSFCHEQLGFKVPDELLADV